MWRARHPRHTGAMASPHTPSTTLAALRALCRQGLPGEALITALLEGLHALVPSQRNLFDWTDEQGRLLHYVIEGPIDLALARLYFEEFHNRLEAEAMAPFQALRHQPAGVRGPDDLQPGFYRSALYHEIWRPQGFHSRLEAVVRSRHGRLLGSLVLYRGPDDPAFTADEARRLHALLPDLADGLDHDVAGAMALAGAAAAPDVPAPEPAETLLLTLDGQVCHASAGAWRWLLMASGGVTPRAVANLAGSLSATQGTAAAGDPLLSLAGPGALLAQLLAPLRAWQARGGTGALPASRHSGAGPGGSWVAQAQALHPLPGSPLPPLVQVQLQRHEPHGVALERALRGLPVTPGQAAVCRALYHGQAQARIAEQLGVASTTVIDHVRKAYRALNLHTAQELRALLDLRMAEQRGRCHLAPT